MIIALLAFFAACNNGNSSVKNDKAESETVAQLPIDASKVAVFYFHSTRRCETCVAIENVTSKAMKDFYKGAIPFTSYNIEKEDGAKIAEEFGVNSSALIIKRGEEKIDITNEAFMYGRTEAEKLRALIKEKIEPLK